jgi:phosphate starvation-inducible PhoH-like protein
MKIMQKLVEKHFDLPDSINPVLLYGHHDNHVKLIENELDVRLIVRGTSIKLIGEENQVNGALDILNETCHIIKRNGSLTKKDLETVIQVTKLENYNRESNDIISVGDNNIGQFIRSLSGPILPKSSGQKSFLESFEKNDIIFAIGPAGTGKTYLAVAMAVMYLKNQTVKKIILARPAVEAGESLGFLPGDFREKIDPYLKPLYDALEDMLPRDILKKYMEQEVIEILPLAYMRGRTLNNAFVILDEAQNSTFTQMKMFLTRLGFNSKAVVTGDITQIDLPSKKESGLISSINVLSDIKGIAFIHFSKKDVVRHYLVKEIIDAYEKYAISKNDT